MNDGSC